MEEREAAAVEGSGRTEEPNGNGSFHRREDWSG